ncbi:MAG TPA: alpha/beta hydrolase-fold protein [Steroidobacteraceae bacterium]|nr:alpha/beta hydrolase-fold protein [Steroidobacteraceae bacterium]
MKRALLFSIALGTLATATDVAVAAEAKGTAAAPVRAEDGAPDLQMPRVLNRSVKTYDLKSSEGVAYRVFVSAPEGDPPPGGFPVLYVLDGNAWTGVTAEIARVFEYGTGPSLVVGVGYPIESLWAPRQRVFDTTMPSQVPPDEPAWKTGGADAFLRFLTGTVQPLVAARYRINPARQGLFGHSLTGLFVLHALFTQPDSFSLFVAASPSIWWGGFAILQQEQAFADRPLPAHAPRALLTVGSLEAGIEHPEQLQAALAKHPEILNGHKPEDLVALYEQLARSYRMVDAAREMAERLSTRGLDAKFILYEDEEHNTEAPMAITRALEMLLAAP